MAQRIDRLYWELDASTGRLNRKVGLAQGKMRGFSSFMRSAGGPIAALTGFGFAAGTQASGVF